MAVITGLYFHNIFKHIQCMIVEMYHITWGNPVYSRQSRCILILTVPFITTLNPWSCLCVRIKMGSLMPVCIAGSQGRVRHYVRNSATRIAYIAKPVGKLLMSSFERLINGLLLRSLSVAAISVQNRAQACPRAKSTEGSKGTEVPQRTINKWLFAEGSPRDSYIKNGLSAAGLTGRRFLRRTTSFPVSSAND